MYCLPTDGPSRGFESRRRQNKLIIRGTYAVVDSGHGVCVWKKCVYHCEILTIACQLKDPPRRGGNIKIFRLDLNGPAFSFNLE